MEPTQLLQAGGVLGILVIVIGYLLNSNRLDRKDAEARADAAEAREKATREAATERERQLQQHLDEALRRARAAEEREARLAAEIQGLRQQIARLEGEVARLRAVVGAP